MKRKLSHYERKLREVKDSNSEHQFSSDFERLLLEKINHGHFDNKNCKKGRKRNYHQFFEKHYLEKFICPNSKSQDFVEEQEDSKSSILEQQ